MEAMPPLPRHARLTAAREAFSGNPLLLAVAAVGFAVSFETIAHLATSHHLPGYPVLYPIGLDIGIFAMIVESRLAIRDGKTDLVPRAIAWALSLGTVYVNAHGAPAGDLVGRVMHVVMPCLWIASLELSRWRLLRKERASHQDKIPRLRWMLSPFRTAGMKRRMVLHNVASYATASLREEARLAGRDLARATWGKQWHQKAPRLLVHHLATGTLPIEVSAACEAGKGVAEAVEEWVAGAAEGRAKAVAKTRAAERAAASSPASAGTAITRPAPKRQAAKKAGRGSRSEQEARRARAKDMWRDNPALERKDIIAANDVSPKTADRIKSELIDDGVEFPRRLQAVG